MSRAHRPAIRVRPQAERTSPTIRVPLQPERTVLSAAVAAALAGSPAAAQDSGDARTLDEIVVTSTRVERSLQDIPIAVAALGSDDIDELGVANFSDYVLQLPGVTAGGSGPGQRTIYNSRRRLDDAEPDGRRRGRARAQCRLLPRRAAARAAGPQSRCPCGGSRSHRSALGPQGTLFGASSQAGNVRLITNKPDPEALYGSAKFGANTIRHGDNGANVELMLNVPVGDRLSLRGVVYSDRKGGWIDYVPGALDASRSARFRPAGTVRANGVPVGEHRGGFQAGAGL